MRVSMACCSSSRFSGLCNTASTPREAASRPSRRSATAMMGPEFRPRSFRHCINSAASVPLPPRSTRVKLKLSSASASRASSAEETATPWYPRTRRKPRSPSCVVASTSTTSARRSVIFTGGAERGANVIPNRPFAGERARCYGSFTEIFVLC